MIKSAQHAGVTLVELILFLGVVSLVATILLPLFFAASEHRVVQQNIAFVELNGTHIMQQTATPIRHAERIVSPALGQTGSVLVLQMSSGAINPTIIGVSSGRLIIIEKTTRTIVSESAVTVSQLLFRNTSGSGSLPSVFYSFTVARTVPLTHQRTYARVFQTAISAFPLSGTQGTLNCGCGDPLCLGDNQMRWGTCTAGACNSVVYALDCP